MLLEVKVTYTACPQSTASVTNSKNSNYLDRGTDQGQLTVCNGRFFKSITYSSDYAKTSDYNFLVILYTSLCTLVALELC